VQVALSVTVGREGEGQAKVRFWVVDADAAAKLSREAVQEIRLVLTPVDTQAPLGPGGKPVAPLIEGAAVAGED
jgi:hypothetical protein